MLYKKAQRSLQLTMTLFQGILTWKKGNHAWNLNPFQPNNDIIIVEIVCNYFFILLVDFVVKIIWE